VVTVGSFPLTVNDPATTDRVAAAFATHFGDRALEIDRQTVSEDFSNIPNAAGVPYTYWGWGSPMSCTAGLLTIGTPAAASRACSARTSRTWIQIITECPDGPAACPETSSSPWPRKNTSPGSSGGPNSR